MNYYNEIKNKLIDNEINKKIKDYSKNKSDLDTYYNVGKLLNEAGSKYGEKIIDGYSKKLVIEFGKKYNRRTLYRMKQFYNVFSNEKVSTMWTQLTWSHIRLLFNLNLNALNYKLQLIFVFLLENLNIKLKLMNMKDYQRKLKTN